MIKLFFRSKIIKQVGLLVLSFLLVFIGLQIAGVEKVLGNLRQFPLWIVFAILILFSLNLALVSFRLQRLLKHSGISVPFSLAFRANMHGSFASLFLISLFGQVLGRQKFLKDYGVRPILLTSLTAIERVVLLFVSGLFCLLGAVWVLDIREVAVFFTKIPLISVFIVFTLSMFSATWIRTSKLEKKIFASLRSQKTIINLLEILFITALAQCLVFGTFVIGVKALSPDMQLVNIFAAAAITSFVASLPISVNGWGLRELAAVFAFGHIGVSSSSALAVSILVGLCSTLVVLGGWPYIFGNSKGVSKMHSSPQQLMSQLPMEKVATWGLVTAASVLIFFQIHLPVLEVDYININLSDLFVVLALTSNVIHMIYARELPRWCIPKFNLILLIISGVIFGAFLNGMQRIGITQWALVARLFGWLILIGYLSVGVLTLSYLGRTGLLRLIDTLITTAVVIVLFDLIVRSIASLAHISFAPIEPNFQGFSANRNSFAFQLLICSALLIARIPNGKGGVEKLNKKYFGAVFALGVMLVGVALTASKAGIITGAIVLLGACFTGVFNTKFVFKSVIFGFLIWLIFVVFFPWVAQFFSVESYVQHAIQSSFSNPISGSEHLETTRRAFEMWANFPWFGAGLGVFLETSRQWFSKPMIIHSSHLWILTEFGIVGFCVMAVIFSWVFFQITKTVKTNPRSRATAMLLATFLIFGIAHDVFYQRMFWMALGFCIALPYRETAKQVWIEKPNQ